MKILIAPVAKKLRTNGINAKNYPYWASLIALLKQNNHHVIQIGIFGEPQLTEDFRLSLPLDELKKLIAECDLWISVDSFLPHLAQYIGKTGVVLWGPSDPEIYGYKENLNLLKDHKYLRKDMYEIWEKIVYNPDAFFTAEEVYERIKHLLK